MSSSADRKTKCRPGDNMYTRSDLIAVMQLEREHGMGFPVFDDGRMMLALIGHVKTDQTIGPETAAAIASALGHTTGSKTFKLITLEEQSKRLYALTVDCAEWSLVPTILNTFLRMFPSKYKMVTMTNGVRQVYRTYCGHPLDGRQFREFSKEDLEISWMQERVAQAIVLTKARNNELKGQESKVHDFGEWLYEGLATVFEGCETPASLLNVRNWITEGGVNMCVSTRRALELHGTDISKTMLTAFDPRDTPRFRAICKQYHVLAYGPWPWRYPLDKPQQDQQ